MKQSSSFKSSNNKDIKEPQMAENIELLLQQTNDVTIPAIIFECISNKDVDFEINDLKNFYSSFGEVVDFIIKGKLSIVLYKTFFSANVCREFLLNENNFKENMKKEFLVRWFDYEKDMNILPINIQKLFHDIHNKNVYNLRKNYLNNTNCINPNINPNDYLINDININDNINYINNINSINNIITNNINKFSTINEDGNINQINNINNDIYINQNQLNLKKNQGTNIYYISPNMIMQYNQLNMNNQISNNNNNLNNLSNNNLNLINAISNLNGIPNNLFLQSQLNSPIFMNQNNNGMNIMDIDSQINNYQYNKKNNNKDNNNQKFNSNQNIEEKNIGRYTCKYEILIPNDKDFQIARRLIGSKGYNMKRILNECKTSNNIKDNVKLRLRGRGSGYKEGPENKESNEPLHLCISAKNKEEMNKACKLVDNLLNKIYEEYKNYCIKNNIISSVNKIANKIDCGNSLHKMK